jgi:parvulin-like peptidyl-prolyl isomerase
MIMKRIALLALFSCLSAMLGFAQADLQPVAIVNLIRSVPITVKQFRTEVERVERATQRKLNDEQRRQVLDGLINEQLVVQAAERDRITVADSEINRQIDQLRASMVQTIRRQPTDAEFATAIRNEYGLEMAAFRDQIRRQTVMQRYLYEKKKDIIDNVRAPTDAEISNHYNNNRTQFIRPETIRLQVIQVSYGLDATARTRARELADRLAREIGTNTVRFNESFRTGQTGNSGYQAGDVGYVFRIQETAQQLGDEFVNVAFSLKEGEVSRLIEGRDGYQIFKVTETLPMKTLELDDVLQPMPGPPALQLGTPITVRNFIRAGITQERQNEALVKATEELVAELRATRTFQIIETNIRTLTW